MLARPCGLLAVHWLNLQQVWAFGLAIKNSLRVDKSQLWINTEELVVPTAILQQRVRDLCSGENQWQIQQLKCKKKCKHSNNNSEKIRNVFGQFKIKEKTVWFFYLAIETQVQVIGWNLENQRSHFCSFGDGGLVDGRREKRNVVVYIWRDTTERDSWSPRDALLDRSLRFAGTIKPWPLWSINTDLCLKVYRSMSECMNEWMNADRS